MPYSAGRNTGASARDTCAQISGCFEDRAEKRTEGRKTGGQDADVELYRIPHKIGIIPRRVRVREDFCLQHGFDDRRSAGEIAEREDGDERDLGAEVYL